MSLFQNGHLFNFAVKCCPPENHVTPMVVVEMSGPTGLLAPVVGKVDTGAYRTMLNFDTARALGIEHPAIGAIHAGNAHTATDESFPYYVHRVMVQIADDNGSSILFPLEAAFAERVKRNLFGVDWLEHLCLAVDLEAVHFLRD